jgi:hypothetical protein
VCTIPLKPHSRFARNPTTSRKASGICRVGLHHAKISSFLPDTSYDNHRGSFSCIHDRSHPNTVGHELVDSDSICQGFVRRKTGFRRFYTAEVLDAEWCTQ